MQYMLVLTSPPTEPTPDTFQAWALYTRALADAGALIDGAGLQPPETATLVQVRGGERVLTDGPFTEAKEHLVGYYLIDVPDLDAAIEWAAKIPNVSVGSVEIRPAVPGTQSGDMLAAMAANESGGA